MSFIGGVGSGPSGSLRFSSTRGRIQGSLSQGINYPSPFFDVAHTYLPTTFKALFRYCRYYFLTNPLINAVVFKLSEYPITDIIIDHESTAVKNRYTEYFQDHLRYRAFQTEAGLDFYCFSGDTPVITAQGVFPIRELAGQNLRVLSQDGVYRSAEFKSFGKQQLWEVHTDDGVMFATAEHEWIVVDKNKRASTKRVSTKALKGKSIPRVVAARPEQNNEFWEGVRHGIVYGDGTLSNEGKQAHVILYTKEKRVLAKFFEGHATITPHYKDDYLGVYGLPPSFKKVPVSASANYWYGFTCGLLSTDGCVDCRGDTVLTQKNPEVLLEIASRLPWFGLVGGRVREHRAWNSLTKQIEAMNYLGLKKKFLRPQDFIRPDQLELFTRYYTETAYGKNVRVKKVVPTNRFEEVFCCVEPETHSFVVGNGVLTGNCYGNSLVSLGFPFKKYLKCKRCKYQEEALRCKDRWVFTNYQFRLTCPKCGDIGDATTEDVYIKNADGIKLNRWNPEDIEITYNDITGKYTYFYTIPATVKNDIIIGRKDIVADVPQVFIQAMKEQKGVIFSKDNLFHFKRPTLAHQDRGWGIPLLLPVLKDAFYLQIMKKAQESLLLEHIVPLRVLFPQAGGSTSDPYCVSPSTLIETPKGLLPASEVKSGDYLRSHTGRWRKVEAVKSRQIPLTEKVYKITAASLPAFPFVVSEDHPILAVPKTVSRGWQKQLWTDTEFCPAKDLRVGDYVAYPVHRTTSSITEIDLADYCDRAATDRFIYRRMSQQAAEIYEWLEDNKGILFNWGERASFLKEKGWDEQHFNVAKAVISAGVADRMPRFIPLGKEVARLIGYYLAEGYSKGGIPSFGLNINEKHISDCIERDALSLGFRQTSHYEHPEQCSRTAEVQDVILGEFFDNSCGKGFAGKRIPQFISEAPNAIVLEMLRCLFEGDGCSFKTDTNRVALGLANPHIILEARRLLLGFGLIGCITREEPTATSINKEVSFDLNYNGGQAEVLRILFAGGKVAEIPNGRCGVIRDGYVLLRINEIEEVLDVPTVIGFQMAVDKSFCVAGVATHNSTISLMDWRDHVAAEIARWRWDNNYIPIMPIPLGNQTIGGDGKSLLLVPEINAWSDQIINGMQVPVEFVRGGMSWAGTNVSMRMLENQFLGYIMGHKALCRFIVKQVSAYMDWPEVNIRFKPFKMADDIQRKAFLFQLNQAQKVSDTTLLTDSDLNQEDENQLMLKESDTRAEALKKQQLAMAAVQGEAQLIMGKYQIKAQQESQKAMMAPQAPGEPGAPEEAGTVPGGQPAGPGEAQMPPELQIQAPGGEAIQAQAPGEQFAQATSSPLNVTQRMQQQGGGQSMNISINDQAMMWAKQLSQMAPEQQQMALSNLQSQSPELADLVKQYLSQMGGTSVKSNGSSNGISGVDMRPLPDKLPPRRQNSPV